MYDFPPERGWKTKGYCRTLLPFFFAHRKSSTSIKGLPPLFPSLDQVVPEVESTRLSRTAWGSIRVATAAAHHLADEFEAILEQFDDDDRTALGAWYWGQTVKAWFVGLVLSARKL